MGGMRIRSLVLALLAVAVPLSACVPEPTNRPRPSTVAGGATPIPTPIPTPTGPTPSPSYVRPTPKPLPTFLVHVVGPGDSLVKIARQYGTDGRSIAYWNRLRYPSLDPDSRQYRPNYLQVGWTLDLIPNHEVDPEDLPGEESAGPDTTVEPEDLPDESVFEG